MESGGREFFFSQRAKEKKEKLFLPCSLAPPLFHSSPVLRRSGGVDDLVDLEDPATREGAAVEGLLFLWRFFVERERERVSLLFLISLIGQKGGGL